jgi:hypothetical protein
MSLASRYALTTVNDDYEEAVPILDEIIAHCSPGNSQDEYVTKVQGLATGAVAALAMMRSTAYQNPEYLEEAIYRTCTWVSSSAHKEHYPSFVLDLEATAKERFLHFGSIEGVDESSGNSLFDVLSQATPTMLEDSQTIHRLEDLLFVIVSTGDVWCHSIRPGMERELGMIIICAQEREEVTRVRGYQGNKGVSKVPRQEGESQSF